MSPPTALGITDGNHAYLAFMQEEKRVTFVIRGVRVCFDCGHIALAVAPDILEKLRACAGQLGPSEK